EGDYDLQTYTLQNWVDETLRRRDPFASTMTIRDRYESLSDERQEVIDLMPVDDLINEIGRKRR
ncbi:MAG: hypothetical protein AAF664_20760, partial [Planctomycetota bacterium]